MRVVSLLPSATEIVCALGAGPSLVGVSHECDHPPSVRCLPAVTRARIDSHATSVDIDAGVRDLVARGLGVYEIEVDLLRALRPDLIVTQDQCDVCAVPAGEVAAAARAVLGAGVTIVTLAPRRLADVWSDVARVAVALDRGDAGGRVLADVEARLAALERATAGRPRPTVACIEWLDPLMLAANWIPELVAVAGGRYPFAVAGRASARAEWSELVRQQPDAVVLMPCGFPLAQTRRELDRLRARPEWRALAAVRAGGASMVDGNAYFNRPGPRLVESAEILAALLHPEGGADHMIADAAERLPPLPESSS